jgi:hypothetical protein
MLAYLAATACRPLAFATLPVRLPCRGAELPATRPPCPLAVRPPPSLLSVVAPPASLPPFSAWRRLPAPCRAAAVLSPVGHRRARPAPASPPPVPACRLPCPQGSGLHPPCLAPPCSTGSSAQHLGPAAPAGLLPARRDDASRQSVPSLSLLQTPVLYATVSGIVLLLKFDLSCLNFFAI